MLGWVRVLVSRCTLCLLNVKWFSASQGCGRSMYGVLAVKVFVGWLVRRKKVLVRLAVMLLNQVCVGRCLIFLVRVVFVGVG